jgi:hypothetical protein
MRKSYSLILFIAAVTVLGAGCATHQGSAARAVPPGPVYTNPAPPGVLPAGTEVVIRTNQSINTNRAVAGQEYSAEVARPIVDIRGYNVVPAGSRAELVVVNTSSGGTFGTPRLELALRSITVNGRNYEVASDISEQQASQEGLGANRRTGEMVGGGAALGTLIGAIAGGGTGAAIGAVAGAAGGAAVQVVTRGDKVHVPAETLLTFRLDRRLRLVGYR